MPDEPMPSWAVRMETKLDIALTHQDDHEARIRVLEARPAVSPQALWTAVLGAASLVAAVTSIADKITS